jgi:hypothetical protein
VQCKSIRPIGKVGQNTTNLLHQRLNGNISTNSIHQATSTGGFPLVHNRRVSNLLFSPNFSNLHVSAPSGLLSNLELAYAPQPWRHFVPFSALSSRAPVSSALLHHSTLLNLRNRNLILSVHGKTEARIYVAALRRGLIVMNLISRVHCEERRRLVP